MSLENENSNGKQNENLNEHLNETQSKDIELDFDELEKQLEAQLEDSIQEMDFLEDEKAKINNPESLGKAVGNIIWDQLMNQIAATAGEDFVKENRGLRLDLRDEAHIQTTENFADGKIASHNTEIDYQKRYDDWQSNFVKDENGNVVTHKTRTGKEEATLTSDARKPFDEKRPKGSKEDHTDMDHTVSAAEIIRDPAMNAHMTKEEQVDFANSEKNLNEIDSSWNRSKKDKSMDDWLDNPNANGQKPDEIFDNLTEEKKKELRAKDAQAREEKEKRTKEAEQRSIKAGKKSQKEEALRIGGAAARAVLMNLLAEFVREIISKLIRWFRSTQKSLATLLESLKSALHSFLHKLKTHLLNAGDTLVTTVADAIWGPIVGTIKKFWIMLKQGGRSLKEAIDFLRNPENKQMPFEIKLLQVGKIVVAGLTAGGAIVLGEAIEKLLMGIPGFGVQIPLLGSLANILGIFLGAVVAGIIGAIAIHMIEKRIESKLKANANMEIVRKGNEVLNLQQKVQAASEAQLVNTKIDTASTIANRHAMADNAIIEAYNTIEENIKIDSTIDEKIRASEDVLDKLVTDATDKERQETGDGLDALLKELMEDD